MGKRKKSENAEVSIENSTKRIKLENDDNALKMDSSEVSQSFIGMSKDETVKYHNDKLKMGMNRYVGMSYQRLKR